MTVALVVLAILVAAQAATIIKLSNKAGKQIGVLKEEVEYWKEALAIEKQYQKDLNK